MVGGITTVPIAWVTAIPIGGTVPIPITGKIAVPILGSAAVPIGRVTAIGGHCNVHTQDIADCKLARPGTGASRQIPIITGLPSDGTPDAKNPYTLHAVCINSVRLGAKNNQPTKLHYYEDT
jgi:hypothetical protein